MNKPQIRQSALLAFLIAAVIGSSAMAAPQDDVFKRPSDKKVTKEKDTTGSSTKESSAEKSTQQPAASSIKKESTAKETQQSDGWFTITDDVSATEFRLPGKPKYLERTFSPIMGRDAVVNHRYVVYPSDVSSFEFSWMDLHEAPATQKQLNEAFDGAVRGSVVNVIGQLDRMDKIKSGKIQGREFDFTFNVANPKAKTDYVFSGRSRIFISGNRRYQLDVITLQGKEDAAATKKFFDSLIIKSE